MDWNKVEADQRGRVQLVYCDKPRTNKNLGTDNIENLFKFYFYRFNIILNLFVRRIVAELADQLLLKLK